ncbi:Coronin protein crn1 [Fasciola hepatica]|uniref:Coronin protein crn1 n=1 Tax=Fasciola hepatica TaxID=6192 RepID=A0A4E0RTS1_FASHE|nr:Coronin protein crn1 [Fasciola hepatica]
MFSASFAAQFRTAPGLIWAVDRHLHVAFSLKLEHPSRSMSRRHLESALVAGAMIESGMSPCFRFTRIRFARFCFAPGYNSNLNRTEEAEEIPMEDFDRGQTATQPGFSTGSTVTATCTCCPTANVETEVAGETKNFEDSVNAMFGEGDCEKPIPVGTTPCRLHVRDFLRRHPWRRLQDDYAIHSVQFSGDGKLLLAGSANTSVRVIHTADGSQRIIPRPSKWALGMPITAIRFMPPKLIWAVACNSHGEVFTFNPNAEGFETLFKEPQQTYTLDISPDGTELVTAGVDRKIRVYTLQPGSLIGMPHELAASAEDEFPTPSYRIDNSNTLSDGTNTQGTKRESSHKYTHPHYPGGRPNQIVDETVRRYVLTRCYGTKDLQDSPSMPEPASYTGHKQPVPRIMEYIPTSPGVNVTEGHSKRIMAVRYHPSRFALLFSAGWDNLVKLWDTRLPTGPVWQIYGPHVASPDGLDIDDDYLLTASWRARASIEVWDMRTMNSNTGKMRNFQCCASGPGPNEISSGIGAVRIASPTLDSPCPGLSPEPGRCTCNDPTGPAEVIPISGPLWIKNKAQESGEYPYAARLLPSRAVVAAGSGFQEVRVVGRDTLLPIARIPMDSVVQTLDTILEGRYISAGCSSGTVAIIGLA